MGLSSPSAHSGSSSRLTITDNPLSDEPRGTSDVVHGLSSYIASGGSNRVIIVIISDAFGWESRDTRLLADMFARKTGWTVYVPDFFGGWCSPRRIYIYIIPLPSVCLGR